MVSFGWNHLTLRRFGPRPGFRYNAPVTNRVGAALLLLVLLAAFPFASALPAEVAAIRLAGVSLLWWYAGVVAPLVACLVAIAWLPDGPPPRRPE